jgi:hypothetical protein
MSLVHRLSDISVRGLAEMYEPRNQTFPRTVRAGARRGELVAEGMSVRYAAIAALGLSRLDERTRRQVLAGRDVHDLLPGILGLALAGRDQGGIALAVWAAVEVGSATRPELLRAEQDRLARALDKLTGTLRSGAAAPTVEHAWTVLALLAASGSAEATELAGGPEQLAEATDRAVQRLLVAQGPGGLFPHAMPADRLGRFRSHVACFADQAYTVLALARYARARSDGPALTAAARCADRLVALQGDQGQWWWHYDWRHGRVVERYPVYSFHQHALAPMAFLELRESGGPDHRAAVARGLGWLVRPPESNADLIADELGVVWRKIGRHEPRRLVRRLRSAACARRPGRQVRWLERLCPPGAVDRECRPFELGWLLYAWHPARPAPTETVPRVVLLPDSEPVNVGDGS